MHISVIDDTTVLQNLNQQKNPFFKDYLAFYSTWLGGITRNPALMVLPIDDHMVHRGDGVFETLKAINRGVYLLDEHIDRLFLSAELIGIQSPFNKVQMKEIILKTLQIADQKDVSIRLFLSRGPGNLSVNPYDSVGTQFYVVITRYKPIPNDKYLQGVTVGISRIPTKVSWLARVKSCNYLPNVLMKKEAVDRGIDFSIVTDDAGFIAEGATENIMMMDDKGLLVYPEFTHILKGTTLLRVCELATHAGYHCEGRQITFDELCMAREVMLTGTTLDVLPVISVENHNINTGKPGEITQHLRKLIGDDIKEGPKRTDF